MKANASVAPPQAQPLPQSPPAVFTALSPHTPIPAAAAGISIQSILCAGTPMIKYPNKVSRRPEERTVRVVGLWQSADDAEGLAETDSTGASIVWDKPASKKRKSGEHCGIVTLVQSDFLSLPPAQLRAVREIRLGQNTKAFELHGKRTEVEERAFSIIYTADDGSFKVLNLVAPTKEVCVLWVSGLHMLLANSSLPSTGVVESSASIPSSINNWLETRWKDVDSNNSGTLELDSVTQLMGRLNIRLSRKEIKSALKSSGIAKNRRIRFEEFEQLFRSLRFRPEVGELFSMLAKSDPSGLSFDEFELFLCETQKNDFTRERCIDIFKKYSSLVDDSDLHGTRMGIEHFTAFLLSANNSVFRKANVASVCHDMNHPISQYFINSSHNTYLLGDQFAGECSVEGYIRALQRGCRCIELDCFDGTNGPTIYHKNSLTNKILFKDVIDAISRYAFVASPYPVILSLETHCSLEQQGQMAKILIETIGSALVMAPLVPHEACLPSPADLKGRILVKGKVVSLDPDVSRIFVSSDEDESDGDLVSAGSPSESSGLANNQDTSASNMPDNAVGSAEKISFLRRVSSALAASPEVSTNKLRVSASHGKFPGFSNDRSAIKKRYIIEKSLTDLVVYFKAVRYSGVGLLDSMRIDQMISISENKFLGSLSRSFSFSTRSTGARKSSSHLPNNYSTTPFWTTEVWTQYHAQHVTRIYPSPLRISSSNIENPCLFWECGVQMVAINLQTFDRGCQVNTAMFAGNGGCGWLLKRPLRSAGWSFDGFRWSYGDQSATKHLAAEPQPMVLAVQVISAQQLPSKEGVGVMRWLISSPPCVEIEIAGCERDCAKYKTRTSTVGGFNAVWKEEFRFRITNPDLAVLRFQVFSGESKLTNEVLGCFAIAVENLELGYRHVPLLNRHGEIIPFSTLFLRLSIF
ncbi:1-phosphatidylinositol 4,5-bisphosphate phosphodiesterase delta-4 [Entophlyctis sp. JEL0112]|nr:1-phosphatidylinositol 4,5-bisphosphate phosphodiesterase delta-4 [Entophlyctis sp. JEL0112]